VVVVNSSLFEEPIRAKQGGRLEESADAQRGEAERRRAPANGWRVFEIPAMRLASECGSSLAAAMVLVGAYAGLTGLVTLASLVAGLEASLPERRRQHREQNERALHAGFDAVPRGSAPAWPARERAA